MNAGESDLQDLYQEVILDHNKRPHNFRAIEDGRKAEGYNPLCGDRVTVYLRIEDGRVADASFQGSGCAISKASASLMTDSVKGKTLQEVEELFEKFQAMITRTPDEPIDELGKCFLVGEDFSTDDLPKVALKYSKRSIGEIGEVAEMADEQSSDDVVSQ